LAGQPQWCQHKLNRAERVICHNSSLWEADNRNVDAYFQMYNAVSHSEQKALNKEKNHWLKDRNAQCLVSVEDCIEVYEERILDLEARFAELMGIEASVDQTEKPTWCRNRLKLKQVEKLICNTPTLWDAENHNKAAFEQLYHSLTSPDQKTLKNEQSRWLKQRNSHCWHSIDACLQVYEERMAELNTRFEQTVEPVIDERVAEFKKRLEQSVEALVDKTRCQTDLAKVPVTSSQTLETHRFNQLILEASFRNEFWIRDTLQVALKFVGPFEGDTRLISHKKNNPRQERITITIDGLFDESIRGELYQLSLEKNQRGLWQLKEAQKAWRCWCQRGHDDFSIEFCL